MRYTLIILCLIVAGCTLPSEPLATVRADVEPDVDAQVELAGVDAGHRQRNEQQATAGGAVSQVNNDAALFRSVIRWNGAIMLGGLAVILLFLWRWGYRPANWHRKAQVMNGEETSKRRWNLPERSSGQG